MHWSRRAFVFALAVLAACKPDSPAPPAPPPSPPAPPATTRIDFSFTSGFSGWEAAFSDYSPGQEASIDFRSGHERLPAPLDNNFGIFLSSHNRSADVFMYVWRPVTGLAANRQYRVDLDVTLASNVPPGCVGIGSSPGESVTIKAGGSPIAPANITQSGRITTNFSKGNQSQSGQHAVVIGNFAFGGGTCTAGIYQRKTLTTDGKGPTVTTDSQGRLWLIVGTDSGFEGFTKVYILEGRATLTPI